MFCSHCGSKMKEGQKFCSNCGKPVYSALSNKDEKVSAASSEKESNKNFINPVFDNKANNDASNSIDEIKDLIYNGFAALKKKFIKLWKNKTGRIICLSCVALLVVLLIIAGSKNNVKKQKPVNNKSVATTEITTTETTTTKKIITYKLSLNVNSMTNLIFSTYDIEMFINENRVGRIKNGESFVYNADLTEGEYIIKFRKSGDDSISTEITIPMHSDVSYKCTLNSHSDSLKVHDEELKGVLSGIKATAIDVVGMIASDANKELTKIGFSNLVYLNEDEIDVSPTNSYIIVSQSVEPGNEIDTLEEFVLRCKSYDTFINDEMKGLTVKGAKEKAEELGVDYTWLNYLTNNEMSSKIEKMDDEQLDNWKVENVVYDVSVENFVKIYLVYVGEVEVPDVKGMVLSKALKTLKKKEFSNIEYTSNNGKQILDTNNWVVISQSAKAKSTHNASKRIILTCKRSVTESTTTAASTSKSETKTTATKKATTVQTTSIKDFKNSCKKLDYNAVARHPNSYNNAPVYFKGKVMQVSEKTSIFSDNITLTLLINATEENGYWSDLVYVTITISPNGSRLLKDDIVKVYGICKGTTSYTTVLGASRTVPMVEAEHIDIFS